MSYTWDFKLYTALNFLSDLSSSVGLISHVTSQFPTGPQCLLHPLGFILLMLLILTSFTGQWQAREYGADQKGPGLACGLIHTWAPLYKELYQDSVLQPESWRVSRAQGILGMLILQDLQILFLQQGPNSIIKEVHVQRIQLSLQYGPSGSQGCHSAALCKISREHPGSFPSEMVSQQQAPANVALTVLWLLNLRCQQSLTGQCVSSRTLQIGKSLE